MKSSLKNFITKRSEIVLEDFGVFCLKGEGMIEGSMVKMYIFHTFFPSHITLTTLSPQFSSRYSSTQVKLHFLLHLYY